MKISKLIKSIIIVFAICLINSCSPKIQQSGGLRAPADINIDGTTMEWPGNKLQAHNSYARIDYTICNDDDNLYLTVRSDGHNVIDKIMFRGVIFKVSNVTGSNSAVKDTNKIAITFPVISANDGRNIIASVDKHGRERFRIDSTARLSSQQLNVLLNTINEKAANTFKTIKVTGIKAFKDSVLLITDTKGIKATGQFNSKDEYIYELAIPLKSIGLSVNRANSFTYVIGLKGIRTGGNNGELTVYETKKPRSSLLGPDVQYVQTPIEISGEYILAKK